MLKAPFTNYLEALHGRHLHDQSGEVADYIPELASADPDPFGIAVATVSGSAYEVGDSQIAFTIQSISKPLTYGLAIEELGEERVRMSIGVEPTGDAFNSITLDQDSGTPLNPMVNAGAIAAVGLLDPENRLQRILDTYSAYCGRRVEIDDAVRAGEAATGERNRAIAHLLRGSGAIDADPIATVEDYFAQCAVLVDSIDLAMIAATLANGGVNPRTGVRAASAQTVRSVLSVMMSCGMYNHAGAWMQTVGLPAKSGVAGGIIAVLPGQLGMGTFSPRLDDAGNSVRGVRVCETITKDLGLHMIQPGPPKASPIRTRFRMGEVQSKKWRPAEHVRLLRDRPDDALILELQGELDFSAAERVASAVLADNARFVVLDLHRIEVMDDAATFSLTDVATTLDDDGRAAVFCGSTAIAAQLTELSPRELLISEDLDRALEIVEDALLGDEGEQPEPDAIDINEHALFTGIDGEERAKLIGAMEHRTPSKGDVLFTAGDAADELLLVTKGSVSGYMELRPGHNRRVMVIGPGGIVGDLTFASSAQRAITAHSDGDSEIWILTRADFERLVEEDPALIAPLLQNLMVSIAVHSNQISAEVRTLID